jgi:hypothetical protein
VAALLPLSFRRNASCEASDDPRPARNLIAIFFYRLRERTRAPRPLGLPLPCFKVHAFASSQCRDAAPRSAPRCVIRARTAHFTKV